MILIHRAMERCSPDTPVDVMVTPQFYTMKRESLPIKYAYQAKRIASSLFDGLLDEDGKYDFFVFKEGEVWVFIAYDPDEITTFLESKGISAQMVSKLFFAQQSAHCFKTPVRLGEREALSLVDDTVVVVPVTALSETVYGSVDEHCHPSKGVRLESGAVSWLTQKQAMALTSIFLLFALIWALEGRRYGTNNIVLQEKLDALYEANPALQSAYARESVASKYRKIDQLERRKRELVGKIAGMIFKGVTVTHFSLEGRRYTVHFLVSDARVAKRLEGLIKRAGMQKSPRSTSTEIIVEGSL